MKKQIQLLFTILILMLNISSLSAAHILGGELSHEYIGNNEYIVTAKLYRDCNGIAAPSSITIRREYPGVYQDIQIQMISVDDITPVCPTEPTVCSGVTGAVHGIEQYVYQGIITVSNGALLFEPYILFSWNTCCLLNNNSISGMNQYLYLYSIDYLQNYLGNNSPLLSKGTPIFNASIGDDVIQGSMTNDVEKDSIVYSLMDCLNSIDTDPSNSFYDYHPYNTGYSGTQPFSTASGVTIDNSTGNIRFTPTIAETSLLCVKVEEYRNGVKISEKNINSVMVVANSSNQAPKISGINGTATTSGVTGSDVISNLQIGQSNCFDIAIYDAQNTNITWDSSLTNATYNISGTGATKTLTVCWNPSVADFGTHFLTVTAEDDNCPLTGKSIRTFELQTARPYLLEGQIFQPDGNTLIDAVVSLYDTLGMVISTENTTNGYYQFVIDSSSINQSYYLSAKADLTFGDLGKTYSGNKPVLQYASAISIYTGDYISTSNVELLDSSTMVGNGAITGTLTADLTGVVLPNTRMVLIDANGNYVKEFTSDQNGLVDFYGLPDDNYEIWVDKIEIDNDVAPSVNTIQTLIHNNVEMILHDSYLELGYPTKTQTIKNDYNLTIIPNPSNGIFNINFNAPENQNAQVHVLDLNGRIIQQLNANNTNTLTVDLSGFPSQVYLVRLVTDRNVIIRKVYKE
jgi:hypothetical protein